MGYVGLWRCYLRYLSDEVTVSLSVEYFFLEWSGFVSVCGLGAECVSGCGLASVWVGFRVLSMLL